MDGKTKKIVSFRITKGNVHDSKKFVPLVRKQLNDVVTYKRYMQIRHMITERTSTY